MIQARSKDDDCFVIAAVRCRLESRLTRDFRIAESMVVKASDGQTMKSRMLSSRTGSTTAFAASQCKGAHSNVAQSLEENCTVISLCRQAVRPYRRVQVQVQVLLVSYSVASRSNPSPVQSYIQSAGRKQDLTREFHDCCRTVFVLWRLIHSLGKNSAIQSLFVTSSAVTS
jgi:hypothetical protein